MAFTTLVAIILAANGILGFLIFFRSQHTAENRWYASFVIWLSFWIAANFLENEPNFVGVSNLSFFLRLDFALGVPVLFSWFKFCAAFSNSDSGLKRWLQVGAWAGAVILPFLCFADLIVASTEFSEGIIKFATGPLWWPYAAYLVFCTLGGLWLLAIRWRSARAEQDSYTVHNLNLIFFGFFLSFGNALFINLVLQSFFPISLAISRLGIYGMIFLVGITAYAIVRHQFLDTKVIVVEALSIFFVLLFGVNILNKDYPYARLVDIFTFMLSIVIASFIIRNVRKEVNQRQELERLTRKLEETNIRLGDLSRFKSQILSIASHQIKSPLAIMKGYLTLILQNTYGPVEGDVRKSLEKVKESADGLTALIEDLLNLRKAEEGKMDYHFANVDLRTLITPIVDNFTPVAARKGIELIFTPPAEPLCVSADGEKLKQVFQNLVDNSLKYTPKGFIKVELGFAAGKAQISVSDSGLGMAPELLPRLFGEFVRDARVETQIQGSGFGLYVAKKIVEAHGGTIRAESEGEGKGSAFIVTLPVSG
jgi:signal transduction histidine kinase